MTLITSLTLYSIILSITTFMRKHLTYKCLKVLLILNNFFFLGYCLISWNQFVLNNVIEIFSLKLNPNTWTGVIYEIQFKINFLSFLFILLVLIIGTATNIYILNYFKFEERAEEFILLINWFMLSMISLVCGNNFFTLILGWELIGLTSFLLINFWKFKITTLSCSFKAFTFNKISDLFLLLGFCILWELYQVNNIDTLLTIINLNYNYKDNSLFYSAMCLILCSSIKSAQIFGHLWLPDSMEAPVPASSLIHSATLVSAGIFLILKFQTLFFLTNLLNTLFLLGGFTACYGGIIAASQTDVKRLLAYSTISHCGFIISSIALNNIVVSITYLYLHGLYKALTFFCAGSLIKYNNTQDTRLMGSLKLQLVNSFTLLIASINLGGLPFLLGYLYKQIFLISLLNTNYNMIGFGFCLIGMLASPIYVFKLNYYSCFDFRKGSLQTFFLNLQNTTQRTVYTYFTYTKVFAFFVIFLNSCLFFIILKYYILKNYLNISVQPNTLINNISFLSLSLQIKMHLIKLYYSFFVLVCLILILQKNRINYFYLDYLSLFSNFISLACFINIIFFITHSLLFNYV